MLWAFLIGTLIEDFIILVSVTHFCFIFFSIFSCLCLKIGLIWCLNGPLLPISRLLHFFEEITFDFLFYHWFYADTMKR